MSVPTLILASSSPARRELLARLQLPFTVAAPDIDETRLPNESVPNMVLRLGQQKAQKIALLHPNAYIIGCDQAGMVGEVVLGKPLTYDNAVTQLRLKSGKKVTFYAGLCLLNAATGECQSAVETYEVEIKQLSDKMIEHYLQKEKVLQCAGSLHVEGLGITLIERLRGDDYTALIGLPLIRLTAMLTKVKLL